MFQRALAVSLVNSLSVFLDSFFNRLIVNDAPFTGTYDLVKWCGFCGL